jgi:hypothetical protein
MTIESAQNVFQSLFSWNNTNMTGIAIENAAD